MQLRDHTVTAAAAAGLTDLQKGQAGCLSYCRVRPVTVAGAIVLMLGVVPGMVRESWAGDVAGASAGSDGPGRTVGLLLATMVAMLMPAGFALVAGGLSRAKNAAHTALMTFLGWLIATTVFWIAGFAVLRGEAGALFLRTAGTDGAIPLEFFSQTAFLGVVVSIPVGAMAERWSLKSFTAYAVFVALLLFPVVGGWTWGGGWLARLGTSAGWGHGYVDFAGAGVVHAIGGLSALAGTIVLGPRIGKFGKSGSINPLPAHNIPMALLGCSILTFGWFGLNISRALALPDGLERIGLIATTTLLAGAGGALAAAVQMTLTTAKPDPTMCASGLLAGLVAISGACGLVGPTAAFLIGVIAGLVVCLAVRTLDRLRIDDPAGAVSVHGLAGVWGVLAVGIFANGHQGPGSAWNGVAGSVRGCLAGDWGQLAAQLIGILTLVVWSFGLSYAFFRVADKLIGLRVPPEIELEGLDIPETGVLGYPDFQLISSAGFGGGPWGGSRTGRSPAPRDT